MKIFLDPMTTKILFYIYLPPIIGGTVLVPYPYEKPNPNLIQNIALTYPTPIIIPPEDIVHLKQQDWTEYPFGFSRLRSAMEAAQARLDFTILSPIIYKHYSKPIIHWKLDPVNLNNAQVLSRFQSFQADLETTEPTSDLLTTTRWSHEVITGVSKGFSAAMDMIGDVDSQLFAALGVPETYFKPKGTSDRMLTEQDKIFVKEMRDRQEYFSEEIRHKIFYPALRAKFGYQSVDQIPIVTIRWRKMIMTDDSIEIQNTIALLQAQIIDKNEARSRLSLPKTSEAANKELIKDFTEESTQKLTGQIPATTTPVPMAGNAPGPTPTAQPGPEQYNIFQDNGAQGISTDLRPVKKSAVDPRELAARFGGARAAPRTDVGHRMQTELADSQMSTPGLPPITTVEDSRGTPRGGFNARMKAAGVSPADLAADFESADDSDDGSAFKITADGTIKGELPEFPINEAPRRAPRRAASAGKSRNCPFGCGKMNGDSCPTHGNLGLD
jgi:hypothetical protein